MEDSELQACTENQGSVGRKPCPRDRPGFLAKCMRNGFRMSDVGEFLDCRARAPDREPGGRSEWS